MSRLEAMEPVCSEKIDDVDVLIEPKAKDLGGFSVRRVLPASKVRSVGPFVFFDEMGPADFAPGEGINVRPHPHIGLSTVTFLFEGEILHRDSLGYLQPIEPGAVNLMTAGKGIVHSERTSDERLAEGQKLHGIQVWMALPEDKQEIEPEFVHYPRDELPVIEHEGIRTTVIIGEHENYHSPVAVHARTLYLEQKIDAGIISPLATEVEQRAVYVVSGEIRLGECRVTAGNMAVVTPGAKVGIEALALSHVMIIGGETFGPRYMWWNFVHTSAERMQSAKADWKSGAFPVVPGDDEYIPLPEK